MSSGYSDALGNLVDQLAKLPGIGRKSAQRLAFHALCQKFLSIWQFSGLLFTVFTLALMTHFYISDFNEGTLCEKKYLPYCFIFSF